MNLVIIDFIDFSVNPSILYLANFDLLAEWIPPPLSVRDRMKVLNTIFLFSYI
jgi:hypothetical protein